VRKPGRGAPPGSGPAGPDGRGRHFPDERDMAPKDLSEVEHCVYMIDLVIREIVNSPKITDKRFAVDKIVDGFRDILRHEGYAVTSPALKKKLVYHE
jgi:hypothetical protein